MIRETLFAHVCGYGVPNVLELHDGTGALIAFNNNWAADDNHRWHYHRQPSPRYPSQWLRTQWRTGVRDHRRPAAR